MNDVVINILKQAVRAYLHDSVAKSHVEYAIDLIRAGQIQEAIITPDMHSEEFDFNSLIDSDNYETVTGLKVTIDKILKDITGTTVLGIGGTLVVRGVRLRIVWDPLGNVLEYKRITKLFSPCEKFTLQNLFEGATTDMFRLVSVQRIEKTKEINQ